VPNRTRYEVLLSLKISGSILLISLVAASLIKQVPTHSWFVSGIGGLARGLLHPGIACASFLLRFPADGGSGRGSDLGVILGMGIALDVILYTIFALLLIRAVANFRGLRNERLPSPSVSPRPDNLILQAAVPSLAIGFVIDLVVFVLGLSTKWKPLEWLIDGGVLIWNAVFGGPYHSMIWLVAIIGLNGLIYSALVFAGEIGLILWNRRG
jgi:hypothetical protein